MLEQECQHKKALLEDAMIERYGVIKTLEVSVNLTETESLLANIF